jgi:hypothetical protein
VRRLHDFGMIGKNVRNEEEKVIEYELHIDSWSD